MNKTMLKPAILSVSLLTIVASAAVSPALNEIKNAFPSITNSDVKLVLTLPALVMVPFSLLSGWLSARFSKKNLLYVGISIYLLSGLGGGFSQSFTQLLAFRAFLGVAIGLLMPLSSSLIFDYFEGSERNKMMGLSGSSNQLGGMVFLSLSGILASYNWRYSFAVYALALVTLVFVSLWMPSDKRSKQIHKKASTVKVKLNYKIFGLGLAAMLMMIVFFVVSTDLALFIENERPVFSSETKLFENKTELAEAMRLEKISDYTIESFRKEGIELSTNTTCRVIIPGEEWKFTDTEKEYVIRKKNGSLIVYSGIGTSRIAGYALSFMGIPAVFAGIILSFMLASFKNYLIPFSASLMALGYYLLSISDGIILIFVAVAFIGLSGGLLSPPITLMIPKVVPQNARVLGIAIVSSCILFGQFVSPYFMKAATTLFNDNSFRFRFQFLAVFIIISAFIVLVGIIVSTKKELIHE